MKLYASRTDETMKDSNLAKIKRRLINQKGRKD